LAHAQPGLLQPRTGRAWHQRPPASRWLASGCRGFGSVPQISDALRAEFIDRSTGRVIDVELDELPDVPAEFPDVASPHEEMENEAPADNAEPEMAAEMTAEMTAEIAADAAVSEMDGAVPESAAAEPAPPEPGHTEAAS
jgi:hypothetical protein